MPLWVSAARGPQERCPIGGYFMKSAKRRASAPLLIIGAMTAAAPASITREAVANSPTGMRTIVGLPARATAATPRIAPTTSMAPCCMSSVIVS